MLDPMTHIFSEECFRFLLQSEGKRARRYMYFFSVLAIGADRMDGPETLLTISDLVRQSLRSTDLVGRIEARSLYVILPYAEPLNMCGVGRRICDRVATHRFLPSDQAVRQTVSIGGACFPTHCTESERLLPIAEEWLRRARSGGGNRMLLPPEDWGESGSGIR